MVKRKETVAFRDLLRALIALSNDPDMDDKLGGQQDVRHLYDAAIIGLITMRLSTCSLDLMNQDEPPIELYLNRLQEDVLKNLEANSLTQGVHPDTGKVVKRVLKPRPL
jgi:hypothetical protein